MTVTALPSRPFGSKLRLPRLALTGEMMAVGALSALLFGSVLGAAQGIAERDVMATPPAPPPMVVRPLAPVQAAALNRAIPISEAPNPAAAPFAFKGSTAARGEALECLAGAIYYEAGSEALDGQRAVAQVVLNRVRHPAFPSSVCGVVFQGSTRATGCQFSFTCDGSLARRPDAAGWRKAMLIANAALSGSVYAPVGWATHYHADYVVPYWASTLAKNMVVGAHLFYRWAGGWGGPKAFGQRYSGLEASVASLRAAALAAEDPEAATVTAEFAEIVELPGVAPLTLTPSMRGDKRVAVRFNQVARAAANEAARRDYAEEFDASDNLRWSLSDEPADTSEAPLGSSAPPPSAAGASSALQQ